MLTFKIAFQVSKILLSLQSLETLGITSYIKANSLKEGNRKTYTNSVHSQAEWKCGIWCQQGIYHGPQGFHPRARLGAGNIFSSDQGSPSSPEHQYVCSHTEKEHCILALWAENLSQESNLHPFHVLKQNHSWKANAAAQASLWRPFTSLWFVLFAWICNLVHPWTANSNFSSQNSCVRSSLQEVFGYISDSFTFNCNGGNEWATDLPRKSVYRYIAVVFFFRRCMKD